MTDTLWRQEPASETAPTVACGQQQARGGVTAGRRAAQPAQQQHHEVQLVGDLTDQSARQGACLAERLASLRSLQSFWGAGEVRKMLHLLQRLDDPVVTADILNAGILKGGRLDLECALVLLPSLDSLIGSTYEDHVRAGLGAVSQLTLIFGQLIRNTRAIARDMLGVDLSAEARQQRCQAAYEQFNAMLPKLRSLASCRGALQRQALDVMQLLRTELELEVD
jgi:hypothetical protein